MATMKAYSHGDDSIYTLHLKGVLHMLTLRVLPQTRRDWCCASVQGCKSRRTTSRYRAYGTCTKSTPTWW